ncbi:hypothetical protein EUTSA_v10019471mg [Eutrema salsugineum]|uniref:DUF4408 domain-containing protein n=1 Tax=Eutrema salsugineum TaxID=72664 RepID=V4KCK3_EUTSA|nr:hypothetical protein EUTSA_v10019471mg [Eutrema salsugineum]
MVSSTIKAVLISTGITVVAIFLKVAHWSSFLLWLKPPYLFVINNVKITIIVASSSYHDGEEDEIFHGGNYKIQTDPNVNRAPLQRLEVKNVDFDIWSHVRHRFSLQR